MTNRAHPPRTAAERIAERDHGRHQVRRATRAAVAGGIGLTALFAGIAYSGTHAKSATLVSAHHTSAASGTSATGASSTSSGSSQSTVSSSSSAPVVTSGAS
jgi:hypothetical protein